MKGVFFSQLKICIHIHQWMLIQLIRILQNYGHSVECKKFSELDLTKNYEGYYVLYQSAEDIGVFYKDYISDIVYFLEMQGAILLPSFTYFLAHHNKNFMELLRLSFKDRMVKICEKPTVW